MSLFGPSKEEIEENRANLARLERLQAELNERESALKAKERAMQVREEQLARDKKFVTQWKCEIQKAIEYEKEHARLAAENANLKATCNQRRAAYQAAQIEAFAFKKLVAALKKKTTPENATNWDAYIKKQKDQKRAFFQKQNETAKERAQTKDVSVQAELPTDPAPEETQPT